MSIYPIVVRKESGRCMNEHGGKDYHLVLVSTADKRALFITRFGKAGAWGSMKVERYDTIEKAKQNYDSKRRQKIKGEYTEEIVPLKITECKSEAEFRKALGDSYWGTVGAGNIEWLLPGHDTKGMRADADDSVVETSSGFGKRVRPEARKIIPEGKQATEDRVSETPIWGMF